MCEQVGGYLVSVLYNMAIFSKSVAWVDLSVESENVYNLRAHFSILRHLLTTLVSQKLG